MLCITDQRESCGSLDTPRSFLLRLPIHGCRLMIYMTGGCTIRTIWLQQVTAALCQGSVSATTWTGSFALCQGSEPSDPRANGHATQPRVATQDPDTDICPITKPAAPSTSARSDVAEPRHAVVSVTNNLRHLRQFFHNNLSNLFVLYLTGSLPCDYGEVAEPSQPRGGHARHIDT